MAVRSRTQEIRSAAPDTASSPAPDPRPTRRDALHAGAALVVAPVAAPLVAGVPAPAPVPVPAGGPAAPAALLPGLEAQLRQRLVGQDAAVAAVAGTISASPTGQPGQPGRPRGGGPLGSFLFLGPTGVGKTMLARALAEALFESDAALLCVDASAGAHAGDAGATPADAGAEQASHLVTRLVQALGARPGQVVFLDEIDRARPEVLRRVRDILERGRLTDDQGRTADFRHAVLVLAGGGSEADSATPAPPAAVPPELLSRVDEVVRFTPLRREHQRVLLERLLDAPRARLGARQVTLELSEGAADWLLERGYDDRSGARPLARLIREEVEAPLTREAAGAALRPGDRVLIDVAGSGAGARLRLDLRRAGVRPAPGAR